MTVVMERVKGSLKVRETKTERSGAWKFCISEVYVSTEQLRIKGGDGISLLFLVL